MRISYVLGHELPFPPSGGGGVNSLLHSLTKAIAKEGHEVTAYSPSVEGRPDVEELDGVRHLRVRGRERAASNIYNQLQGIPYSVRLWHSIEPCDVLNCHLLTSFLFASVKRARLVTHTIHRDPKRFIAAFNVLDRVYTGSEAVTEAAIKLAPWMKSKFRTIHNCVDFDGYLDEPRPRNRNFTFIYVGRVTRDKGIEPYVRGFLLAAAQVPELRLRIIGPLTAEEGAQPDFVAKIREMVARSPFADRVTIVPPIYDRAKLDEEVRSADAVCLPSLGGETLNMSILECLRLSRPVLISNIAANLPLVADGQSGFLVDSGVAERWRDSMLRLASLSDDMFMRMARAAYSYGRSRFASRAIAERYIEDFSEMLWEKR